jgi:hypothetical protein
MVLTDWPAFGGDLPADLIKSGIAISGIFDLEPIRHTPIGDKPGAGKNAFLRAVLIRQIDHFTKRQARDKPWRS